MKLQIGGGGQLYLYTDILSSLTRRTDSLYPFSHLFIQHTITKFPLCTRSVLGVRFSENENTVPVSKQPEVWTTLVKMCITPPSAIHRMTLIGRVWCVRCGAGAGLTVQKMESLHTHNHSDLHKAGAKMNSGFQKVRVWGHPESTQPTGFQTILCGYWGLSIAVS